jgi:hypothetical protein
VCKADDGNHRGVGFQTIAVIDGQRGGHAMILRLPRKGPHLLR